MLIAKDYLVSQDLKPLTENWVYQIEFWIHDLKWKIHWCVFLKFNPTHIPKIAPHQNDILIHTKTQFKTSRTKPIGIDDVRCLENCTMSQHKNWWDIFSVWLNSWEPQVKNQNHYQSQSQSSGKPPLLWTNLESLIRFKLLNLKLIYS